MIAIAVLLTLHLPGVRSLKEKRAVVRSLVERLRSRLDLSAAEVGAQDELRRAQIGFAVVSGDVATARRLADEAMRFADGELLGRAEVVDGAVEELVLDSEGYSLGGLDVDLDDAPGGGIEGRRPRRLAPRPRLVRSSLRRRGARG